MTTTSSASPLATPMMVAEQAGTLFSPHSGIAAVVVADLGPEGEPDIGGTPVGAEDGVGVEATVIDVDPMPPLPMAVPVAVGDIDHVQMQIGVADGVGDGGGCGSQRGGRTPPRVARGRGMMTDSSHEDLARRARGGDEAAMQALLEAIDADGLIRIAVRRVVMDAQAVEDISQDVLILVAEKLGSWDGRSRFTTWLYAVSRNRAIDHLRRTRPVGELPADVVSDQARLSSLIATRETVRAALARIPERYRTPLTLHDVDQLDYDEIARMLDLLPATVRTRVHRGRAMVAAAMVRSVA